MTDRHLTWTKDSKDKLIADPRRKQLIWKKNILHLMPNNKQMLCIPLLRRPSLYLVGKTNVMRTKADEAYKEESGMSLKYWVNTILRYERGFFLLCSKSYLGLEAVLCLVLERFVKISSFKLYNVHWDFLLIWGKVSRNWSVCKGTKQSIWITYSRSRPSSWM